MTDLTVLAFPADAGWVERLRSGLRGLGRARLIVAGTVDEACEVLECAEPRLVIIHGDATRVADEQLDEILWINSTLVHPARVAVASEDYNCERAVALFQMGVDEYLGDPEHWNRLSAILGQLLSLEVEGHAPPRILPVSEAPARPLRPVAPEPLRWVTAEPA